MQVVAVAAHLDVVSLRSALPVHVALAPRCEGDDGAASP